MREFRFIWPPLIGRTREHFVFPGKVATVGLSGLKGRVGAGDYREETIVKVKWDFVSWVLSLYVFMVIEVHHSCQVCLDQLLQLHFFPASERAKVRKVYAHFLLLCVWIQYNCFKTNSLVSNDYCTRSATLYILQSRRNNDVNTDVISLCASSLFTCFKEL